VTKWQESVFAFFAAFLVSCSPPSTAQEASRTKVAEGEYKVTLEGDLGCGSMETGVFHFAESWTLWRTSGGYDTAVLEQTREGIWHLNPVVPGAITEPGLVLYRFDAPLYCANANRFSEETRMLAASAPSPLHWLVVDAAAITNVDFTAARVVRELQKDLSVQGTGLVFAHVQSDLKPDLDRHHLSEVIGPSRIFDSLHEALAPLRGSVPSC